MNIPIDEIRVAVIVVTLLYASYTDIKRRRVSNKVWIPASVVAVFLIGYESYSEGLAETLSIVTLSVVVIGGLSYILFYFRVIYGADYKAFVVVALLIPTHPEVLQFPIYNLSVESIGTEIVSSDDLGDLFVDVNRYLALNNFGFSVLVNSAICSVVYFFMNAYHNIVNGEFSARRPLRSVCARKIESENITEQHAQVIGETERDNFMYRGIEFLSNGLKGISADFYRDYLEWHRNRRFTSEDDGISDLEEIKVEKFSEESEEWIIDDPQQDKRMAEIILGNEKVWITPGIPFILPMTLGVILSLVFGNLWYILVFLL